MFDLIVIGGGPSGVTAALRGRELGARVALVERSKFGGTCTNDGCVPTRVLAKAARLRRDAEQFEEYGLMGKLPEVDFERAIARTQQIVYKIHEKKQISHHLDSVGVSVYEGVGSARFIDPHTIELGDGSRLEASKFIICAGGHARRISFPGSELALTHHDVWSLKKLPSSVAIVGGSATGSQLASIFSSFGSQVWLLEVNQTLLGPEDPEVARAVRAAFEQRGMQVITGIGGVDRIEKGPRGVVLHYKHDETTQPIEAEAVVMAVGWVGNLEGLNLEAAGVQSQRGSIQVNDYLQTSAEHIFAAGDITGRIMLVQSGSYDARIAAENAVLGVGQPHKHQIVPHGGFTDPEYGSVGLTEPQATASQECVVSVVPYANMDRAVIDDRQEGFCKLIVSVETHRILGAHIVGEQALEAVQLVAAGMSADIWVEQLAELEMAYPTFTAVVGLAARQAVRKLGVVPLATEWRNLEVDYASEWERRFL